MEAGNLPYRTLGGQLLKTWRTKRSISQVRLAGELGVTGGYLCHLEHGRHRMNNLRLALRIERQTDGVVDVESWLEKQNV